MLNHYGERVLAETQNTWKTDEFHHLKVTVKGRSIRAWCDDKQVLEGQDDVLGCGAAGFLVDTGIAGFRSARVGR